MISQACATSVAALRSAVASVEQGTSGTVLTVLTDRTSNGPLLVYPSSSSAGGAPAVEHWVLDNFARDPGTGQSMLATAEAVAEEEGIERAELDELTALRHAQYRERSGSGKHVVSVVLPGRKRDLIVTEDEGVILSSLEQLVALRPAAEGARHSYGSQTHPADGTAGAVVTSVERAREMSGGIGVAEILGFGTSRVEPARMPKAPVPAARRALAAAGVEMDSVDLVTTHNPFAVTDVYFAQQMGFPLEKMNPYGCSLVFGHPQAPTGMRAVAELIEALRERGGGTGLFTGCAAGDSGAAVVIRVRD